MTETFPGLVADHLDEGYVVLDDDRIVDWNPAARELLDVAEGSEVPPVSSLPPAIRDVIARPCDGGRARTSEVDVHAGDGWRRLEVEVTPVDVDGGADRLVLLRDVTAHVEARRYREVLEATGDAVYTIDTEGVCTYSNRAHDELYGYEASGMVGMHVSEILEEEVIEWLEDVVRELLRSEGARRTVVEHDVITGDGRRVPVENHISLLVDDDGEFRGTAGVVRDVTERTGREERLERYERIVEAMGDGVYAMDADATYTMTNDQMLEMNGYAREEVIGAGPDLLHDEADIERFEDAIRDLIAAPDEVRTVEATLVRADGDEVPIEVNLTLLTGGDGEFRGTVGVVRDVTERKEREQELERYGTLLDIMPDTVVVTDTEGYIEDLHGFEGWSGYDRDELLGEHLSIAASEEAIEEAEALIGELVEDPDREKVTYEMDVLTKGGERVPHENNLALLPPDEDGQVPGSMSVLRDISDRKERERAMRTLHEATREMVTADSKQAVAEVGIEAAADVLGLIRTGVHFHDEDASTLVPVAWTGPLEEALGEPPDLGPDSLAWSVFEDGETVHVDDLWDSGGVHNPDTSFRSEIIVSLGGHGVALFASTEPGAFDDDDQRFAEVLCSNATAAMDRIGREADLRRRERELERKNERLEEFASVVSHDLRSPLNVAHARVRMAIQSSDVARLEKADAALDRMNDLIDDLLTLAREGQAVGETEPVDLGSVAAEAWEHVEAPDATVSVAVDDTVGADRARLRELFENLFRNAIEHGGKDVTIRVGALDAGVPGAEDAGGSSPGGFYVEDDGPGIPPEEREAVFEQGFTGTADGTGFGLSIVADIADAHGWRVRATEGPDGGARFEFTAVDSSANDEPTRR